MDEDSNTWRLVTLVEDRCVLESVCIVHKMVVWFSDYGCDCDGTHGGSNMFHQPATWVTSFGMFWEAYEQAETMNRKN